jgi:hypothetical protein
VHTFFDEFHRLNSCNRSRQLYLNLFYEFIHCHEDVCESIFHFLEWTYQIQPPCGERPGDQYDLELMGWYMLLASKELTTFTMMNHGVGV